MEKDIKVLEEIVNLYKNTNELPYKFNRHIIQAIENLIYKNKELEHDFYVVEKENKMLKARNKELEEIMSKIKASEVYQKGYEAGKNEFEIKVIEKIEELAKSIQNLDIDKVENEFLSLENYICKKNKLTGGIYYLQELLQEGDE